MKDLKQNLLRYNQRELLKRDLENYELSLQEAKGPDRAVLLRRKAQTERMLHDQSPVPLTPKEKDKLSDLEKKLRTRIVENMPSDEVMRRNPPGAVDWNRRWLEANKRLIRIWKNTRIQLNPDSQDRDLANIERYRPSNRLHGPTSGAQISGAMSYSDVPDANWPFDAQPNSALVQAQKHYDEQSAEEEVEKAFQEQDILLSGEENKEGFGPSGTLSAEEYAERCDRVAKGREALRIKREAAKQAKEAE